MTQTTDAETIARLLGETLVVPTKKIALPVWNLVESDEYAANVRAELLLSKQQQQQQQQQTQAPAKLHVLCAGHKVHQITAKTWEFFTDLHKAFVKTMVFLRSPGMFARFQETFLSLLDSLLVVVREPLPCEAITFRQTAMQLFLPRPQDSAKAHSTCKVICEELLSGD